MRLTDSIANRLLWILFCSMALGMPIAPRALAQEAAAEEPAAEEPAAEEPAADTPAMEEPAAEEPAADAPAADEPPAEEPALDELDAAEKPAPAVKKPRAEEPQEEEAPKVPDDPAVRAVLESHPESPAQLLRAVQILADLGRADLAKPFIGELTKRKLDLQAKAVLADRFNSAVILRLARNEELAPSLAPFLDDLLKSADEFRRDAGRLKQAAKQLSDPDQAVRASAVLALSRARESAVAPLVAILADPKRAGEHGRAQAMLVQLGDVAIAPLLGTLESPDSALKTRVVQVLGRLRAEAATAQLLGAMISPAGTPALHTAAAAALAGIGGAAPGVGEAVRLLEHAAETALVRSRDQADAGGLPREVWHWNAKQGQSMPILYDEAGAYLAEAVRLARDLYRFDPSHPEHRRLCLIAMMQAAKLRAGLDKPLPSGPATVHAFAFSQGSAVVEDVLREAMAKGYIPAATAAAEVLGDTLDAALLVPRGAAVSPLALAAQNADRRLRFAAVNAIMKLDPRAPFAGSSQITGSLAFFASSYGSPRVLVAHPRSDQAQSIAGLAAGLGYETDAATNGRRAFELATSSSDYDFIIVHSAIDRPRADELIAQLRRDGRTAALPVGLVAPLEDLDRVQRYGFKLPRAAVMLQPQNDAEMRLFANQLLALAGNRHVSAAERKAQAIAALDWLAKISSQTQNVFDVGRHEGALLEALYVPDLSARAAAVLGQLGTATSQRGLLDVADLAAQPIATRKAAVAAFARSVRKFGVFLSPQEILDQYGLYNSNAGRDADTHAVLGAILDALEHKEASASNSP
jgi:CheY-like chemotaxis protein